MAPRHDRTTAHRPLLQRPHARRALVNVGGAVETAGDPVLAGRLAAALRLRAGEGDATLTHPFHAYPARLHPQLARALVAMFELPPRAVVLDPFCGSGTVLVEALVAGHRAVGRDLSPLAVELAGIKTRRTTRAERQAMVTAARAVGHHAVERVRGREQLPVPRGEREWFAPHTLREVAAIADEVARTKDSVRPFLRMLLSSVLVKVSRQASDADTRRVHKDVPPGSATRWFVHKADELARCLAGLAEALPHGVSVDLRVDDATALATVPDASVDAVVTSPPYASVYDYHDHHARRYAWLGLDASALAAREVGAARWFDVPEAGALRFRRELGQCCAALARVLTPEGRAAVVIADGAAEGVPLRADGMLSDAAAGNGLRVIARASQVRAAYDAGSQRAFAKTGRREHVVVLARSAPRTDTRGATTGS